jgi:hypothetical protein
MSSLDINIIETWTAINDITATDEYQVLWWDKQWVCWFLAQANTLSAQKLHACTALDIPNSRAVGEEGFGTEGDLNGKMVSSR